MITVMKKVGVFLLGMILIQACSTEFTSIEQAKNELNDNGLKTGYWVEYFSPESGSSNFYKGDTTGTYALITYENGFAQGTVSEYRQGDSSLLYKYKIVASQPTGANDFLKKDYYDTIYTFNRSGNLIQKACFDNGSFYQFINTDSIEQKIVHVYNLHFGDTKSSDFDTLIDSINKDYLESSDKKNLENSLPFTFNGVEFGLLTADKFEHLKSVDGKRESVPLFTEFDNLNDLVISNIKDIKVRTESKKSKYSGNTFYQVITCGFCGNRTQKINAFYHDGSKTRSVRGLLSDPIMRGFASFMLMGHEMGESAGMNMYYCSYECGQRDN